jgi:hypothetical protein
MTRIYRWERAYKAAIDKTDPAKRPERLLQAEQTVLTRILELERVSTRHSINELAWLEKALEGLTKLQSEMILVKSNPESESSQGATTEPITKAKATGSA